MERGEHSPKGKLHPNDFMRFMSTAEALGWDLVQVVTNVRILDGRPVAILRKKPAFRLRADDGELILPS